MAIWAAHLHDVAHAVGPVDGAAVHAKPVTDAGSHDVITSLAQVNVATSGPTLGALAAQLNCRALEPDTPDTGAGHTVQEVRTRGEEGEG